MIRLHRGEKPPVLVEREVEWTDEYARLIAGDPGVPEAARTRYRNAEIKGALRAASYSKCAYCESVVTHIYPGDTEHIKPVSERPDLIVDWHNLAFSCADCNREKGSYYDEDQPLVNPYVEEPHEHLLFLGPLVVAAPGSDRGIVTINQMKLGRISLFERRKERVEQITRLADRWMRMSEGPAKEVVRQELDAEAADDREYAAATRVTLAAIVAIPQG